MSTVALSDDEKYQRVFRFQAMQYYAAGRRAARDGLTWVFGNLLHHAVEAFAKAYLIGPRTVEFLRYKCGHDLQKIWREATAVDPTLAAFSAAIDALNEFEDIRYPDGLVDGPGKSTVKVTFTATESLAATWGLDHPAIKGGKNYEVVIDDIDSLVITLLDLQSVDLWGLSGMLGTEAREAVTFRNAHAARWGAPRPPSS